MNRWGRGTAMRDKFFLIKVRELNKGKGNVEEFLLKK
jgi:hypothetical protein